MSLGRDWCKRAVTLTLLVFLLGCGQGTDAERVEGVGQAIIGGSRSPSTQDATVLVLRSGQGKWCSGVVVAPTLVLTARSCVFDLPDSTGQIFYVRCGSNNTGTPVLRALDASEFEIDVGTGKRTREARGVRLYAGEDLDLCENDMVLIEVDNTLSPDPLALRLDSPPLRNEMGTLVGWGLSEDHPLIPGNDRKQHPMQILAVGGPSGSGLDLPDGGQLNVADGAFVTGEGACFVDQGGPFISEASGAVVGILSILEPAQPSEEIAPGISYCIGAHAVFRSVAAQSAWIRDAFVRAKQVPWLEGRARPAAVGQSCANPGDCASGVCKATTGGPQFCSQDCNSSVCPDGLECVGAPGERWCVPARVPNSAEPTASCALAHASPGVVGWYLLLLPFALLHQRRRLRAFTILKPSSLENPS